MEFVDFGNEKRRDTWFAIIKEIMTAYWFVSEYGPKENDPSLSYMDGSKQGQKRAITSAANSIARLQVPSYFLISIYEVLSSTPPFNYQGTHSNL